MVQERKAAGIKEGFKWPFGIKIKKREKVQGVKFGVTEVPAEKPVAELPVKKPVVSGGLAQDIKAVKELMEKVHVAQDKKAKKFDLSFGTKFGAKGKIKKGYCLVFLIKQNLDIKPIFLPVEHDTVRVPLNDTFHVYDIKALLRYKKYPSMIISEWNMLPYNPSKDYAKAEKDGTLSVCERTIINLSQLAILGKLKKPMGGKTILILCVAGVVALYFISEMLKGGTP